jgi:hypothetical protein
MLKRFKRRQRIRLSPVHIILQYTVRVCMLERATEQQPRLRWQQKFEVFAFCAGTEEHRVRGDVREGLWVFDDCYIQGCEEGFV